MPDGLSGATDGHRIYLDYDLLQVERRCTLAHELAHIDLGHHGRQDRKEEDRANRLASHRLIDWHHLTDAFRWARTTHEAATELWVTPKVLHDRLRFLHPHERALLRYITSTRHE